MPTCKPDTLWNQKARAHGPGFPFKSSIRYPRCAVDVRCVLLPHRLVPWLKDGLRSKPLPYTPTPYERQSPDASLHRGFSPQVRQGLAIAALLAMSTWRVLHECTVPRLSAVPNSV